MEIVDAYEKWEECGRRTPTFLFLFVCSFLFLDCLIMLLCGVRPRGENIMLLFCFCFCLGVFVGGCYRQEDIIVGQD